jgi:arylsulfatase
MVGKRHQGHGVLNVDGQELARTMVKRTIAAALSTSEIVDVGVELGSIGSLVYFDRRPLRFDGTIDKLELKLNGIEI